MGTAGVAVPIQVMRDAQRLDLLVQSADRAGFQRKGTLQ
jgi:hypothetical protein